MLGVILTAGAARQPFRLGRCQRLRLDRTISSPWQGYGRHPFDLSEWGLYLSAPNGIQIPHFCGLGRRRLHLPAQL